MQMQEQLQYLDELKNELNTLRNQQGDKVAKAFDIEYTYESNKIEGNTLTLQETALVIEKGLTIGEGVTYRLLKRIHIIQQKRLFHRRCARLLG